TPRLTGPVNATAPAPVTNAEFAAALAHALHRPAFLRVPAWLLRLLAGDLAKEVLLGGQRVIPDKADVTGFKVRHDTLPSALAAILGAPEPRPRTVPELPVSVVHNPEKSAA